MVLILLALAVAVIGLVRVGRALEPRQRLVLVLAFIFAVVYLVLKLMQSGLLGHRTD